MSVKKSADCSATNRVREPVARPGRYSPARAWARRTRCLRLESLEERHLLSIGAPADWSSITADLPLSHKAETLAAGAFPDSLPGKEGQTFVVDDWDNKVTQNDMGFNYFSGNCGAAESAPQIIGLGLRNESHASVGGSLQVSFDFTGKPQEAFGGYFASLFGLTDTYVSLDGSGQQPSATTHFPNHFLDTQNIYGRLASRAGYSVEQLRFDTRLLSAQEVTLKIELKDQAGFDVFARRLLSGSNWQTTTLLLPSDFSGSVQGQGNPSQFNWSQVTILTFIVEHRNVGDNIVNPDSGQFLLDNLQLVDTNGVYPDLTAIASSGTGTLNPIYQEPLLAAIEESCAQYFLDFASTDPRTGGMIQDRGTFADLISVGGTGFQLTAYVINAQRGYESRADAAQAVYNILDVLANHPQGPERVGTIGYQGFFYHFLGIDGLRKQNFDFPDTAANEAHNTVELSTIDTALVLAGAVTARQYFNGSGPLETEIRRLVDEIYGRVNWHFMLNTTLDADKNQFYLAWKPNEVRGCPRYEIPDAAGTGQFSGTPTDPSTLDFYTDEGLLVALLAMGSPNPAFRLGREVWDAIIRDRAGANYVKTYPGSLFTYQFLSCWVDTDRLGTDNHPVPVDFFSNTQAAIATTIDYATANPLHRASVNAERWGLTATEGPFDSYAANAAPPVAIGLGGSELEFEGENGGGQLPAPFRSQASGGTTAYLTQPGQVLEFGFDLAAASWSGFRVRYSNDGPSDTLQLSLDGSPIGEPLVTQDTRPVGGAAGSGWNEFLWTKARKVLVGPGHHTLRVSLLQTDNYGVEIDLIRDFQPPLDQGTLTNYGVGCSILHAPSQAIASLWSNLQEDLNADGTPDLWHPRFGLADAFNRNVADGRPAEMIDGTAPGVLRSSGAWADMTGFGIDQGPMMILTDTYRGGVTQCLFMSYPPVCRALNDLFPSPLNWQPLSGDWNSDNVETAGLYEPRTGVFFLRDVHAGGDADSTFQFGIGGQGWQPLAGDWDGDGDDTIALYDPKASVFFLRNVQAGGDADVMFQFGVGGQGWQPLSGDWDGDGRDTVGLYDPATGVFYLRDQQAGGDADHTFTFGIGGQCWLPLAGDWNGDGHDGIGLYEPATSLFFLRNTLSTGNAEEFFQFGVGQRCWTPLAGDWDSTAGDGFGFFVADTGQWFLKNAHASGPADANFVYGVGRAGWRPAAQSASKSASDEPLASPIASPAASAVDRLDLAALTAGQLRPTLEVEDDVVGSLFDLKKDRLRRGRRW